METQVLLLYLTGLLNIAFIYVILSASTKTLQNKLFGIAILFNVLWTYGDALMIGLGSEQSLQWSRLFFVAPMFTAYFLILFATIFPTRLSSALTLTNKLLLIPIVVFGAILLINPNILINEVLLTDSVNEFEFNLQGLVVYAAFFFIYFSYSYYLLLAKALKTSGVVKSQLVFMFIAAILSSGPALLTNLVLPLFGKTQFLWLGPIFTIAYLGIVTYTIARFKVLDARIIVARSLAYILSILVLGIIFFSMIFFFLASIVSELDLASVDWLVLFIISILIGLLLQPLKSFFDRGTNRIFYRDAYNSQTQLNQLSDVVVSEFQIDSLMSKSIEVIKSTVRPSKLVFILTDGTGEFFDSFGFGFDHSNNAQLIKTLSKLPDDYYSGQLSSLHQLKDEQDIISQLNDIDVVLSYKLNASDQLVGYVVAGPRLSGNSYTTQDIDFMRIAANELAIAIQNARRYDEIIRFNETLRLEVDRATAELRESNRKLKELDEAKDEFVTMASHQLRTPLTSIKGYISMVMEGDAGNVTDRQRELLGNAFISSQRMVYLIADLLNVSRLRTGKFIIETKQINLKKIIESEIDQLKETADSRGLKLEFKAPKDFPDTVLDENKIRQVIMNFIDNAIYYTTTGGKIEVKLAKSDKQIEMSVKDTGIGVPKRDRPNLFTKFYRAANARKARPDGTGLGLFMAKKVVIAQGGAIIFDSEEGRGSTFGFSFPLSRVSVKPEKTSKKSKKSKTKKSSATKKKSQNKK